MARILGIDIPNEKKIIISLTYIFGIGPTLAQKILEKAKIDLTVKAKDVTEEETSRIRKITEDFGVRIEGELRGQISNNIKRLKDIRSYRGLRHRKGLPLRGQKTRYNSRTRKGKAVSVGGVRPKAATKT